MMDMWMRTFLSLGKSTQDIRMKFLKKWFPKERVHEYIVTYGSEIQDWYSHEILYFKNSNTSRSMKIRKIHSSSTSSSISVFSWTNRRICENSWLYEYSSKEVQKYKNRYNMSDKKREKKSLWLLWERVFAILIYEMYSRKNHFIYSF